MGIIVQINMAHKWIFPLGNNAGTPRMQERRFRNLLPTLTFNPDVLAPRVTVFRAREEAEISRGRRG